MFYSGRVEESEPGAQTAGPSGPAARQHAGSKSTAMSLHRALDAVTGTCRHRPMVTASPAVTHTEGVTHSRGSTQASRDTCQSAGAEHAAAGRQKDKGAHTLSSPCTWDPDVCQRTVIGILMQAHYYSSCKGTNAGSACGMRRGQGPATFLQRARSSVLEALLAARCHSHSVLWWQRRGSHR